MKFQSISLTRSTNISYSRWEIIRHFARNPRVLDRGMARRLLQRKNRKHPEPLHDSIRRGKSRVNEIDLMFPWRVHVMRTMRCAQVHDDEWAFTPRARAESWLSSKDPTICKPRTPTIHRFFRFTPAQSCILIRADFIRNTWQLNGSFGSFSTSSFLLIFYCISPDCRCVSMRSMTRFNL